MVLESKNSSGSTRDHAKEYTKIAQSPEFKKLLATKKSFILPMSLFFFAFYFTLPILTAYSTVLNKEAVGGMSWAWIFAFAQFIMTWTLCMMYSSKAKKFDEDAERIVQSIVKGGSST